MADAPEKPSPDIGIWLIGVIVAASLFGTIAASVRDRFGVDVTTPDRAIETTREELGSLLSLSPDTPLGTRVRAMRATDVWERAGGGEFVGIQNEGAVGALIGGPSLFQESNWWEVDFEEFPDGWVREAHFGVEGGVNTFVRVWRIMSWALSILFAGGIVFCLFKINQVRKEEEKKFAVPSAAAFTMSAAERSGDDSRWSHIETLMQSENPNDWRQAIIEADIILDELVTRMGYDGDTLGDKMKVIEKSDFTTLDAAWEAHKVRNRIAHDGRDFILTLREARRVIELYRQVFEEFHFL